MTDRLDFNKIFYNGDRVTTLLEKGDITPIHMTLGFTGYCDHQCLWCTVDHLHSLRREERNKVDIDPDNLLAFLKEAYQEGLKAVTIVGSGEPLLHSKAKYMLDEMKKMGLDIGMFSNGSQFPKHVDTLLKNMTFVRVSLDAATIETHRKLHGGHPQSFNYAIDGLREMAKRRIGKFPTLGMQFVASQHNVHEIEKAALLAKEIGLDYISYKPMMKNPKNPTHDKNMLVLDENLQEIFKKVKAFETNGFKVYTKPEQFEQVLTRETFNQYKDYALCLGHFFSPYIDSDGTVYVCTEKNSEPGFAYGSINNVGFKEMWNSSRRRDIIRSIDLNHCFAACRQDPLNKILWGLSEDEVKRKTEKVGDPDPSIHPNFV
ncbi:MAG: radical SAM protein [archaeon]